MQTYHFQNRKLNINDLSKQMVMEWILDTIFWMKMTCTMYQVQPYVKYKVILKDQKLRKAKYSYFMFFRLTLYIVVIHQIRKTDWEAEGKAKDYIK